jgi:hypothetical protein
VTEICLLLLSSEKVEVNGDQSLVIQPSSFYANMGGVRKKEVSFNLMESGAREKF